MAHSEKARTKDSDIRVGWLLAETRRAASSRILGHRIHDWMLACRIDSEIIAEAMFDIRSAYSARFIRILWQVRTTGITHLVVVSPSYVMDYIAILARRWGIIVICVRCDLISGDYDRLYDLTILPTEGLQKALKVEHAVVIDEVVEAPPDQFKQDYACGGRIRVVWVGHAAYGQYITTYIRQLRQNKEINRNFEFEIISLGTFATRQWSEATVVRDILRCDIALLPIPETSDWFALKSPNRLALMFSLAMPVVASPLPSYQAIAAHGVNVLFASSSEEMAAQLLELRAEDLRRRLGTNARASLGDRFRMERIGPQWLAAFTSAHRSEPMPPFKDWRLRALCLGMDGLARLGSFVGFAPKPLSRDG